MQLQLREGHPLVHDEPAGGHQGEGLAIEDHLREDALKSSMSMRIGSEDKANYNIRSEKESNYKDRKFKLNVRGSKLDSKD